MEIDEDVVVAEGWNIGFLVELEAVEAILAVNGPLLGG